MSPLRIERLSVRYGAVAALTDVSLAVGAGEIVALVGASGSGKSTLAHAVPGLLPAEAIIAGRVLIDARDIAALDEPALRDVRGGRVGMVFQEPASALNPALTIGRQIGEVVARHCPHSHRDTAGAVVALLARVGLEVTLDRYPHMLSGGQRQRVCVAMAIAARPAVLIADEPTAALDPLARAGIVDLLRGLAREEGMGLLLVSHDLPLVAGVADRLAVLDGGRLVEEGAARECLLRPRSDALRRMVAAERGGAPVTGEPRGDPLLRLDAVTRAYPASGRLFERRRVIALQEVSASVSPGRTLAVVGASGSGKSTLARLALGLDRPDGGHVRLDSVDMRDARGEALRAMRRRVQAVFQDAGASLDPRRTVAAIVAEPLYLDGGERGQEARVADALALVGLPPDAAARRPEAFSGGQRQRIALARALILRPPLLVLDEALSALDPVLRAGMAALLRRLQGELGLAMLFVSHDMALVRQVAHDVLVLRDGAAVAYGSTEEVFASRDPYVAALIAASPTLDDVLERDLSRSC